MEYMMRKQHCIQRTRADDSVRVASQSIPISERRRDQMQEDDAENYPELLNVEKM